jgi:hypothetical protein
MTDKDKILRVGDTVEWQGQRVEVEFIEVVAPGEKYGSPVAEVRWDEYFVADLDNGHFAYEDQITAVQQAATEQMELVA